MVSDPARGLIQLAETKRARWTTGVRIWRERAENLRPIRSVEVLVSVRCHGQHTTLGATLRASPTWAGWDWALGPPKRNGTS